MSAQVCPYCRAGFEPDEAVMPCPACGTPHHADCFAENGGCTIFGCAAAPAEEAKISVGATDLRPAPLPTLGGGIYGLGGVSQPVPSGPAPPPMPAGSSVPPPPMAVQPYAWQGYGAPPVPYYAQGYGYGGYAQPKSRVAYVLLAVFLGCFGAHNFYAGYTKKAVIQLCITICTCFWASIVTWIWAIVEACTITMDDDGVLLS